MDSQGEYLKSFDHSAASLATHGDQRLTEGLKATWVSVMVSQIT